MPDYNFSISPIGAQTNKFVKDKVAAEFYLADNGTQVCLYFETSDGFQNTIQYSGNEYKTFNIWREPIASDHFITYVNYFGGSKVVSSDYNIDPSDLVFDILRADIGNFMSYVNDGNYNSFGSGYSVLGFFNTASDV